MTNESDVRPVERQALSLEENFDAVPARAFFLRSDPLHMAFIIGG